MNGHETSTGGCRATSNASTRLASDTIADTAALSLKLAERLLRRGTVDVSPAGGFTVRLALQEDELPMFWHAIQLRQDLGEAVDPAFTIPPERPSREDVLSDLVQRTAERLGIIAGDGGYPLARNSPPDLADLDAGRRFEFLAGLILSAVG